MLLPGQYFDAESGLSYNVNRDFETSTDMKYPDDQLAHLGDLVTLGGKPGRIVCSIDADEYGPEPDHSEAQWGYLGKGVMAEFADFGLIHYIDPDEDLRLARRGTPGDLG
jgi:hypothetical protein